MNWERRSQVFLLGAPLAVIPAVAFLPVFVFVFLRYPIVRALPGFPWWFAFPLLVFAQVLGSVLVGFAGFRPRIGYISLLAAATSVFLLVVAAYTGLFFAIFAGPN
jgi:hypothetical protein